MTISVSTLFICSVAEANIFVLGFSFLAAGPSEPVGLHLKYAHRYAFDDAFIKKVQH